LAKRNLSKEISNSPKRDTYISLFSEKEDKRFVIRELKPAKLVIENED
jgi:hypothetical protein